MGPWVCVSVCECVRHLCQSMSKHCVSVCPHRCAGGTRLHGGWPGLKWRGGSRSHTAAMTSMGQPRGHGQV